MSDLYPHLLNATCSDDTEQVYVINFGFSFNDLSDKEKEMAFHSQWYLAEKYCKKWQKELANNQWAKSEDEMPDDLREDVGVIIPALIESREEYFEFVTIRIHDGASNN